MFTDDKQQVRQVKKDKRQKQADGGQTKTDKKKTKQSDSNPYRKLKTIPTFRLNDYKLVTLNLHTHIHCKGHF